MNNDKIENIHISSIDLNNEIVEYNKNLKRSKVILANGKIEFSTTIKENPEYFAGNHIMLKAKILKELSIFSFNLDIVITNEIKTCFYLNRSYKWIKLLKKDFISGATPLIIRYKDLSGKMYELRSLKGYHSYSIEKNDNGVLITYYLDHAALHPKWNYVEEQMVSDAATELSAGFEYQTDFILIETDSPIYEFPVVPGRFPSGLEACFCITDHCDFDSNEKLEILLYGDCNNNGWLGKGLKMTKGVFPLASKPWHRKEVASLEDKDYNKTIKMLHEDGSEIVPHGIQDSASLEVDHSLFSSTLSIFTSKWHPGTWIDHGKFLEYSYLKGGDKNEYLLLEQLEKSGIKLLWSYHDISSDSSAGLNLIAPKSRDGLSITKSFFCHFFTGRFSTALHYVRSFLRKRCSRSRVVYILLELITLIKAILFNKNPKVRTWQYFSTGIKRLVKSFASDRFNQIPYSRKEELELASAIFPESGVPINQVKENDSLLFCTNEVQHICDVYNEKSLNNLIREKGIHIGHTYLLNTVPYLNGLFKNQDGNITLKPKWSRFVIALHHKVSTNVLWNPVVSDLSEWTRAMQFVSIVPVNSNSVRITNKYFKDIHDFTLLIPKTMPLNTISWDGRQPKGSKQIDGIVAIFDNLTANTDCILSWN